MTESKPFCISKWAVLEAENGSSAIILLAWPIGQLTLQSQRAFPPMLVSSAVPASSRSSAFDAGSESWRSGLPVGWDCAAFGAFVPRCAEVVAADATDFRMPSAQR